MCNFDRERLRTMCDLIDEKLNDVLIASDPYLWNFDRERSGSKVIGSTVDHNKKSAKTISTRQMKMKRKGKLILNKENVNLRQTRTKKLPWDAGDRWSRMFCYRGPILATPWLGWIKQRQGSDQVRNSSLFASQPRAPQSFFWRGGEMQEETVQ